MRVVLSGDVDPIFALHAIVDFAGVRDLGRERARGDSGLLIGQRTECRQVEATSELGAPDEVVEGVQLSHGLNIGGSVPKRGAGQVLHRRPGSSIDEEVGFRRRFGGEEKVRAAGNPGGSVFQFLGIESGRDGVAETAT